MRRLALALAPSLFAGCEPSVASIEIDPPAVVIGAKGETKNVKATPKKATGELAVDALLRVKWSSSDPSVATVVNGVVTGVKSGESWIIAEVGETKAQAKALVSIPASIALEPPSIELAGVGKSATLKPAVKDENKKDVKDPPIVWSTSSSTVAMVHDGKIETIGIGRAVIIAKVQALEASATVVVKEPEVSKIEVTPAMRELEKVGEAVRLSAVLYDAEGQPIKGVPVTWSSANEKIATVSAEGLVTAVKKGKVKITVSALGKSSELEINVKGLK